LAKRADDLEYIKKYLPHGIRVYKSRNKLILRFPSGKDHRGWKTYKSETVCNMPRNKSERKAAKDKVLDLARLRENEFYEYDKRGIPPSWMKPRNVTFKALALAYIKEKKIEKPPLILRDSIEKFKNKVAADITTKEFENFYTELLNRKAVHHSHGKTIQLEKTLSLSAVMERKNYLFKIYKFGERNGFIDSNKNVLEAAIPRQKVKELGKKKEPKQKAIKPEEFFLIYEQLNRVGKRGIRLRELPDMALISFLTGMRPGETIGLEWNRIFIKDEYPYIRLDLEHVSRGPARIVPLVPPLVDLFKRKRKVTHLRDKRVFKTRAYHQSWNSAVKRSGVVHPKGNIRFHDLRSTFITLAKSAKMPIEDRMKIVGHTIPDDDEIKISEIHLEYYDPYREDLHNAIMKVYNYLLEVLPDCYQLLLKNQSKIRKTGIRILK
jgi:integrase